MRYTRNFVNWRILLVVVLAGTLCSCLQMPDAYAPPVQRKPMEQAPPYRTSRIINMNDPDAEAHMVKDIVRHLEGGSWRWAQQRPTVQVVIRNVENQKFTIDFAIADATFKDTGPVTMSFFVNDQLLDKVRYDQPGQKHFEKSVPPAWLKPNTDNTAAAEIDKIWTSPTDGAKLGFVLTRLGFTQ